MSATRILHIVELLRNAVLDIELVDDTACMGYLLD